jgi:glycosyltransferase involved in cell wall biosynthesis
MKIIQIIQKPQLRGAEMFASQLSNQLMQAGHEVQLISLLSGNASLPFKGKHIQLSRPLSKRFMDIQGWKALAQHIRDFNPDVVQANAGDTLKYAVFSKLLFRWKAPIVFRNANKMSAFITSKPKYWFNKFLLNQVEHTISVSNQCSSDLVRTFRVPPEKIDTIEIGIDPVAIGDFPVDLQHQAGSGTLLLHVGSMVPEKNHRGLLDIFSEILKAAPDARLLLVGSGKMEGELKNYCASLRLAAKVSFLGVRTDVLAIMGGCNALLLPSHIEGLPGVILEAMFAKCPVVAYAVGGIGEVVKHGETGMLIAHKDEAAFVEAVLLLLKDKELAGKMKKNALAMIHAKFDNRIIAERFIGVYTKMIKGRKTKNLSF